MKLWLTALAKVAMGIAGTIILDALCSVDLGIVSWAIVATPFIMVALASTIAMGLGIDRMASSYVQEKFTGLTGDNLKNRDKLVTPLKQADALPLSQDSSY